MAASRAHRDTIVVNFLLGGFPMSPIVQQLAQNDDECIVALAASTHRRKRGETPARIAGYVETVVPSYTDTVFREHFRMSRSTVEYILNQVGQDLSGNSHTPHIKVLAFLWLLGNTESFRSVADRFDIGKSTLHAIVTQVADRLWNLAAEEIKFPKDNNEFTALSRTFRKFPGVIGCVDGTYIPMTGKSGDKRDGYICRKGFAAMHMQVICNNNLVIMDVVTGYPGSVHDARVFRNSPVTRQLKELPAEWHLLGDSAYPLEQYIMTPFRDNGHLRPHEKKFNYLHSSTRSCVERCIGLLKGKFRRLKAFDARDDVLMGKMIVSSAVLHNIILTKESDPLEDLDLDSAESIQDACSITPESSQSSSSASKKRNEIAERLFSS